MGFAECLSSACSLMKCAMAGSLAPTTMDDILEVNKKPWISRQQIKISDLIQDRATQLASNNVTPNDNGDLEVLQELERFAKPKESGLEPQFLFNSTDERSLMQDTECNLKTYQLQLEHAKKVIADRAHKFSYLKNLKTTRREMLMRRLASMNRPTNQENIERSSEKDLKAIVVVQLWAQPSKTEKVKLEREVLFRSDQNLTLLREHFKCQLDYEVPIDLSDNPDQAERIFRGEMFKSGFFFINQTFYNDLRNPNNHDLSSGIIEWASREVIIRGPDGRNLKVTRGLGPLKEVKMEDYRFEDIEFRLGYPYLYLHQGDCEHLFTISDIKYVTECSSLNRVKFPLVTAAALGGKSRNLRCYMCQNRPPHWYTRDNNRLPMDPFFFCETCFHSFNYDENKRKIGKFRAYLYTSSYGIPNSVNFEAN